MANTVKVQGSKTVARARKGDTGNGGITYRVTVWDDGKEYRNDSSLKTDGERIIDIAVNKAMSLIGDTSFKAYKCRATHTSDAQSRPLAVGTYWEAINTLQPIVTPVLLANVISADYIDVENLVAQKLTVKDSNNNVIAKIGDMSNYTADGVSGKFPFWIGGSTPATAVTRIDSAGKLTTTNIVAKGGTIGGFNIGTSYLGLSSSQGGAPNSNGMSLYQEFISFYEKTGTETAQALVGTNVLPASTGVRGLMSISAKDTDSYSLLTSDLYGIVINVSGYRNPYAIYCEEGVFAGFRPQISIENTGRTLTNTDSVISCGNTSAVTFYLPTSPKHGQFYAFIHSTETTMNITSSATHPIMRITKDGTTVVATTLSGSMEVVLLVYNAHATITYNGSTRTGVWSLTYLKV